MQKNCLAPKPEIVNYKSSANLNRELKHEKRIKSRARKTNTSWETLVQNRKESLILVKCQSSV